MTRKAKKKLKRILHEIAARKYERGYDWNGYEVYEPVYPKPIYVGGLMVILVSGDDARLGTHDEGAEYIHYSILKADEEERAAGQN